MNLEEAFIAAGIPAPPARAKTLPSSFIRWGKNNRYWKKLFDGGAIFGDYSTGESHNWFEDDDKLLDAEQIAKRKEKLAALKKEQQEEQARIYEEASVIALNQWNGLVSEGVSPYLQRKQIEAFNIRFDDDKIVIPVYDIDGKLWSLQYIHADGAKRFLYNGKKRGCFHTIGQLENAVSVFVAEGYATAASVHKATENPVIVAFDAGNLDPVIEAIRGKYPDLEITLAGDNDCYGERNTGKEKSEAVAQKYGCKVALPLFQDTSTKPTDWNDLHCLEGLEAVKNQLLNNAETPKEELSDTIKRLSALSTLEYEQVREAQAKRLGVRVSVLDNEVKSANKGTQKQGNVMFPEVAIWHEPVNAGELLNELVGITKRFIICDHETAIAVALWCSFTWFVDVVDVAPLAVITAPEKRCGKSQLLTLIGRFVRNPLVASNISPSAVFRVIEGYHPTLLIDEADTFFKDNEELRGVINSGHTRQSAYVIRNVGDTHEPKQFSTWGAKAISGIGALSDTLMDRAIVLTLRRKLPHEKIERLRHAEAGLFEDLASKLARFAQDASGAIAKAKPNLPEALNDRAQDNWEALLAIADYAGGQWARIARDAALKLSGAEQDKLSLSAELLADIQEVFESKNVDKISSADLISALCTDEEKPWATYNRGQPIRPRQFAKKLAEYDISSKTVRIGYNTPKGFELNQFADAFARYLTASETTQQVVDNLDYSVADKKPFPQHTATKQHHVADCFATENESATLKTALTLNCGVVADFIPPIAGNSRMVEVEL